MFKIPLSLHVTQTPFYSTEKASTIWIWNKNKNGQKNVGVFLSLQKNWKLQQEKYFFVLRQKNSSHKKIIVVTFLKNQTIIETLKGQITFLPDWI